MLAFGRSCGTPREHGPRFGGGPLRRYSRSVSFQMSYGLVPAPVSVRGGPGVTVVAPGSAVVTDPALRPAARWWRRATEDALGLDLALVPDGGDAPAGAA